MTKEEVLERIEKGERYLQRTDLTPEQRENAEARYLNLVTLLGQIEDEETAAAEQQTEHPDEPAVPADVLAHMNRIRGILGMPLRER